MEPSHIINILVDNNSGVLLRVSSLFSRRGYNISSVVSSETEKEGITRITIVAHGDDYTLDQIYKQLQKLVDVIELKIVDQSNAVCREHLLIKVKNDDKTNATVINIANMFNATIADSSDNSIMFELTGEHSRLVSFINILRPYGIIQLMKTGISALECD